MKKQANTILNKINNNNLNNAILEYADTAIKVGINIEPGQRVIIDGPVECSNFARILAKAAYDNGAGDVLVYYSDNFCNELRINKSDKKMLSKYPESLKLKVTEFLNKETAYLRILSPTKFTNTNMDMERFAIYTKSAIKATEAFLKAESSGNLIWSVLGAPNDVWAKHLFPKLRKDETMLALWNAILYTSYINGENDSVEAWTKHLDDIHTNCDKLNNLNLIDLHLTNSLGTNLHIGLPENCIWCGGDTQTTDGHRFAPNIPTEEVYTVPHKYKVNGIVHASKKLILDGTSVDNIVLTVKGGKIVEEHATSGLEVLRHRLNTDKGARHFGEIALVPYESPISNLDMLFYNTLYDENAACHMAFGMSFPCCIKDGAKKDKDELDKLGVNKSDTHVDFMIGTKDLDILGTKNNGEKVQIFKSGNFVI